MIGFLINNYDYLCFTAGTGLLAAGLAVWLGTKPVRLKRVGRLAVLAIMIGGLALWLESLVNAKGTAIEAMLRLLILSAVYGFLLLIAIKKTKSDDTGTAPIKGGSVVLFYLTLTIIISFGYLGSNYLGRQKENEFKTTLLHQTKAAAAAVNIARVKTLKGSERDLNNPDYIRLKDQLIKVRQSDQHCRFVYLMAVKTGDIIFIVDSEPTESPDYTPPGEVYSEASQGLKEIFVSGQATVDGPYYDRWGYWISGFVPLDRSSEETGSLVVLGLDIAAEQLLKAVFAQRRQGIIITLTVILLLFSFFTGFNYFKFSAKKLEASESQLQAIIDNAPEAIFIFDPASHRILKANSFMASWLGYSPEDLLKLTMDDILELGTVDADDNIKQAVSQGRADIIGKRYRRSDGSLVDVEITDSRIDYQGRDSILALVRDVSQRHQSENAIKESENKYHTLFDSAADAIELLDPSGKIIDCNQAYNGMLGYAREEVVGGHTSDFLSPLGKSSELDLRKWLLATGFAEGEVEMRRKDGQNITSWRKIQAFYGQHGELAGAVVYSRDITEKKQTEIEIQHRIAFEELILDISTSFISANWRI